MWSTNVRVKTSKIKKNPITYDVKYFIFAVGGKVRLNISKISYFTAILEQLLIVKCRETNSDILIRPLIAITIADFSARKLEPAYINIYLQ